MHTMNVSIRSALSVVVAAGLMLAVPAVASATLSSLGSSTGSGTALPGGLTVSLSALHLAPRAFKAARSGSSVTHESHSGTRVSFTVSAAARVDFSIERLAAGFTQGLQCVAVRHGGTAKPCTRHVKLRGVFSVRASTGANSFRFSGRLEGHALAPGSYHLVARVQNLASLLLTAHAKQAKPLVAAFRISP